MQSPYLRELVFVMDDDAWRERLVSGLRRHHGDDPGLYSALALVELGQADQRGDHDRVHAIYRELSASRYAATNGWRSARQYDPDRPIAVGSTLPAFSVQRTSPDATPLSEADLAGKAWVIQMWATWCTPCREELDALPRLYETLAEHRATLDFLSISMDDDRALTLQTLTNHAVTWPSAWAPDGEALMAMWGFSGVPLTLLIDREGTIVKIWEGRVSLESIERAALALVERRE